MTSRAPNEFLLVSELAFLSELWALDHAMERVSKHMELLLGLTARQRVILRLIGTYPGILAGQLSSILKVDPGTVSAALARLEVRSLLERRRDTRDQRRVVLLLTDEGRKLNKPSPHTIEGAIGRVLKDTTNSERKKVSRFLVRLIKALDETVT